MDQDTLNLPVLALVQAKAALAAEDENELSLAAGESLEVLEMGDGGWWLARSQAGKVGWIPSNYVTKLVRSCLIQHSTLRDACFAHLDSQSIL